MPDPDHCAAHPVTAHGADDRRPERDADGLMLLTQSEHSRRPAAISKDPGALGTELSSQTGQMATVIALTECPTRG